MRAWVRVCVVVVVMLIVVVVEVVVLADIFYEEDLSVMFVPLKWCW